MNENSTIWAGVVHVPVPVFHILNKTKPKYLMQIVIIHYN